MRYKLRRLPLLQLMAVDLLGKSLENESGAIQLAFRNTCLGKKDAAYEFISTATATVVEGQSRAVTRDRQNGCRQQRR